MLHWINWIVLLSLEPLAGELKYASVAEWSAAGAWAGRVSNVLQWGATLGCLLAPTFSTPSMAFWSHRLIGGLRRWLSNNELTGTVPTELGAMTAMTTL
jgi:hypothetical protein